MEIYKLKYIDLGNMVVDVQKVNRAVSHYLNVSGLSNTSKEQQNTLTVLIKLFKESYRSLITSHI